MRNHGFAKILFIHRLVSLLHVAIIYKLSPKDEASWVGAWLFVFQSVLNERPNWRISSLATSSQSSITSQLSNFKDTPVTTRSAVRIPPLPWKLLLQKSIAGRLSSHFMDVAANKFEASIPGSRSADFSINPGRLSNILCEQIRPKRMNDSRTNTHLHKLAQHFLNGQYKMTNHVNPGLLWHKNVTT